MQEQSFVYESISKFQTRISNPLKFIVAHETDSFVRKMISKVLMEKIKNFQSSLFLLLNARQTRFFTLNHLTFHYLFI